MVRKQISLHLCRTRLWRRSNQALLFFSLLFVSTYAFSADWRPNVSPGKAEDDMASFSPSVMQAGNFDAADFGPEGELEASRYLIGQANALMHEPSSFYLQDYDLPQERVESCLSNMPPLLQAVHAYLKSPDSSDPEKQISSFHRFLLVGPPGTSKSHSAVAVAQDLGIDKRVCEASSLIGEFRGHTSINIRNLFEWLGQKEGRFMLVFNELHKLFDQHANKHTDHSENAHTFWSALDYIERNKPNIILPITLNYANKLPQEIKSRFRVQYIYIPLLNEEKWFSGLNAALQKRKGIKGPTINFPSSENNGRADNQAEINKNPEKVDIPALQLLTQKGLSFRDQELVADAVAIFAYRDGKRPNSNELNFATPHVSYALAQLVDKNQVLDFYAEQKTDEERQDEYHRESLEQQRKMHQETLEQQRLHFIQQQLITLTGRTESSRHLFGTRTSYVTPEHQAAFMTDQQEVIAREIFRRRDEKVRAGCAENSCSII